MPEFLDSNPCASAPEILTPRLVLIDATPAVLRASMTGRQPLAEALQLHVPSEWPPENWDQDAIQYLLNKMDENDQRLESRGWARYIALCCNGTSTRILIGTCGATGPILSVEEPEIGYSILPAYQRQGHCTEAVLAFCSWIFKHPAVPSVCAQTFPHLQASIRVLEKSGFHFVGAGKEEGCVLYRLRSAQGMG